MDGKELWAEGLALAKPCVRLSAVPSAAAPVGCLGGPPLDGCPLSGAHLLSFDARTLPEPSRCASLNGTITLHGGDDAEGEPSTAAVLPRSIDFSRCPAEAVLLYAYPDRSVPCLADVIEYGSPKVHAWLESLGWKPQWRHNGNLNKLTPVAAEYEELWWGHREAPAERTVAVVGGWLFYLADETFPSREPLVTLFAGEEPRRHVFFVDGALQTVDEIT